MNDEAMLDLLCSEDQVENALLRAVRRTRVEYEVSTVEDLPDRRQAYADALRALNAYI